MWIEIADKEPCTSDKAVTPYAGVWIEMFLAPLQVLHIMVTPYAGVWIEIDTYPSETIEPYMSLPTRECGLKCMNITDLLPLRTVTPYAGVWIEITYLRKICFVV